MGFFALSAITGCIEPITGLTNGYDFLFNRDAIKGYFKKDLVVDFKNVYVVVVIFGNYTQHFKFLSKSDRDNFFDSLPK